MNPLRRHARTWRDENLPREPQLVARAAPWLAAIGVAACLVLARFTGPY